MENEKQNIAETSTDSQNSPISDQNDQTAPKTDSIEVQHDVNETDSQNKPEALSTDLQPVLTVIEEEAIIEDPVQKESSDEKPEHQEAKKIVAIMSAAAAATCALPIPFADAPLLITQQTAMILELNTVYHIQMRKNAVRSLVFGILGVSTTTLIGKTLTSAVFKLLPGLGSIAGGALSAATAAALTAALGNAYISVCEEMAADQIGSKESIKLLTTRFQTNLRLEMKKTEEPEDVLKSASVPESETIIFMGEASDEPDMVNDTVSDKETASQTEAEDSEPENTSYAKHNTEEEKLPEDDAESDSVQMRHAAKN